MDCKRTATGRWTSWHRRPLWAFVARVGGIVLPLAGCDSSEVPPEPEPPTLCGNGQIDDSEHCDGGNLNGKTCASLSDAFLGGKLACDPLSCTFDTRGCTIAAPSLCGDGVVEGDEECELGVNNEAETCGSLGIGPPERAETKVPCMDRICRWNRYTCDRSMSCGDGRINGIDACDGDNLNGLACVHLFADRAVRSGGYSGHGDLIYGDGTYSGGTLYCDSNCQLYFQCWGPNGEHCGNGIREGNEVCDGDDLGSASCQDIGRLFGKVSCRPSCTSVDYRDCSGGCSAGRIGLRCD